MTNTTSAPPTSTGMCHVDGMFPGDDMMTLALYLCGVPAQSPKPQSNYEKNIRKILVRDILQNT